jgi:co-chaperonin GroES (HSP10)
MKVFFIKGWKIFKKTVQSFLKNDAFLYAGSIAFSTIFSLPAILIITLSIGSALYEREMVQQELLNQAERLIGPQSTGQIEKIIQNAAMDMSGTLARTIGIATLVDSAKEKPQQGKVIAAGLGKFKEDGTRQPLDVKDGDTILFGKYSGQEIKIDGDDVLIMREDEVLAILDSKKK